MSGTRADKRKAREEFLFSEPQWQSEPACCDLHASVLTALRKVYGSSDMGEAVALADALVEEGLIGNG